MTVFEIIMALGIALLVVLLGGLTIILLTANRNRGSNETERAITLLQGQLSELTNSVNTRMESVDTNLARNLDNTRRSLGDVSEKLGEIRESSKRLEEIGRDVSSLQDLLKPPQARGAVGETLLGNILGSMLPPEMYKLQYALDPNSGGRVDAVITINNKLVPVDAKFPIQDYNRIATIDGEQEKEKARKVLIRNLKAKADDIASKYIRPDLGTYDFALMYIPAEAVYYETMVLGDAFDYAASKNVIPVSPGTFYLYLYTIILGLRGLRVEEEAQRIMGNLTALGARLDAFYGDYEVLGKHLANARSKYDDGDRKLNTFQDSLDRLTGKERDSLLPGLDIGD